MEPLASDPGFCLMEFAVFVGGVPLPFLTCLKPRVQPPKVIRLWPNLDTDRRRSPPTREIQSLATIGLCKSESQVEHKVERPFNQN